MDTRDNDSDMQFSAKMNNFTHFSHFSCTFNPKSPTMPRPPPKTQGTRKSENQQNPKMKNIKLEKFSLKVPSTDERYLLVDQNMTLQMGHIYGLVGPNGCGKSTLLAALAGRDFKEFPKDESIVVKYVTQDDQVAFTSLLSDTVLNAAMKLTRPGWHRKNVEVEEEEEEEAETERELKSRTDKTVNVLKGLGFKKDARENKLVSQLSGGWRRKLNLAVALLSEPDVLLLDEPNNGLDIKSIIYLERMIKEEFNNDWSILVVVSHDVEFLSNVTTDVLAFRPSTSTPSPFELEQFSGNYEAFRENLEREKQTMRARVEGAAKEREKQQAFAERASHSNDPNKQRQARERAEKKVDRIGNYRDDGKKFKTHSLKTLSEDSIRLPSKVPNSFKDTDNTKFKFKISVSASSIPINEEVTIVKMEDLEVKYEGAPSPQLRRLNIPLGSRDKICCVGCNGAGKSLLLSCLMSRFADSNGNISNLPLPKTVILKGKITCDWESKLRFGYLRQNHGEMLKARFGDVRAVDYVLRRMRGEHASDVSERDLENARAQLGGFGLGGPAGLNTISRLSGGQRLKLALSDVMIDEPNVLICDEPTQHLDVEAIEAFTRSLLDDFQGCAIVVTHNRWVMKRFREFLFLDAKNMTVIRWKGDSEEEVKERLGRYFESLF